jgi:hypothetical protein
MSGGPRKNQPGQGTIRTRAVGSRESCLPLELSREGAGLELLVATLPPRDPGDADNGGKPRAGFPLPEARTTPVVEVTSLRSSLFA